MGATGGGIGGDEAFVESRDTPPPPDSERFMFFIYYISLHPLHIYISLENGRSRIGTWPLVG
jgi:hypothetical protein